MVPRQVLITLKEVVLEDVKAPIGIIPGEKTIGIRTLYRPETVELV